MTPASPLVTAPLAQSAASGETQHLKRLERLWSEYKREDARRRWSQAIGGLIWAVAWSAVAVALWRSGTASMYAPAIQLLALTGWLGVAPALKGTMAALLIRFALLGGAVGLLAVPFAVGTARNALLTSVTTALALFVVALAYRGVRGEIRAIDKQQWSAVFHGRRYLLTDDANALRWFVARDASIAAYLSPAAAFTVISRLSARDRADVRVVCAGCDRPKDMNAHGRCRGCGTEEVLVLYSPARAE